METKRFFSERVVIALKYYNNVYYLHRAAAIYVYSIYSIGYCSKRALLVRANKTRGYTHDCVLSVETAVYSSIHVRKYTSKSINPLQNGKISKIYPPVVYCTHNFIGRPSKAAGTIIRARYKILVTKTLEPSRECPLNVVAVVVSACAMNLQLLIALNRSRCVLLDIHGSLSTRSD